MAVLGPLGSVLSTGRDSVLRLVSDALRPLEQVREEAQRDIQQVSVGLANEARLIPLLVEQLVVLNANLATLTEVLRPVAVVENEVANVGHHLSGLFHHHEDHEDS